MNIIFCMPSDEIENVLILQGGGSLGAFACGVFKALVKNNLKIDIVAGTSIGGVNASIIAGSKEDHPERELEQFWLELAQGDINSNSYPFTIWLLYRLTNPLTAIGDHTRNIPNSQIKSLSSFYKAAFFGNNKVFIPRWNPECAFNDPEYFNPNKWTYLYDNSPLIKTLEKYVDFNKLQPNGNNPNSRLIITAVNVLTAEPLAFDSFRQQITPKHILAATAYPNYYFPWVEVEEGIYTWDGSLLSNTPLREVIDASPTKNKRIFLVENYPKKIDNLPANLFEVEHRARDILFSDKTMHSINMSKAFTCYLKLIDDLYTMLENNFSSQKKEDIKKFESIHERYKRISENHNAEIKETYYITREEKDFSHLYENADFSVDVIKNSIKDGELQTNQVINKMSKE